MMITLSRVLTPNQVQKVTSLVSGLSWRDGADTAGPTAREVKRNEQVDLTGGAVRSDVTSRTVVCNP